VLNRDHVNVEPHFQSDMLYNNNINSNQYQYSNNNNYSDNNISNGQVIQSSISSSNGITRESFLLANPNGETTKIERIINTFTGDVEEKIYKPNGEITNNRYQRPPTSFSSNYNNINFQTNSFMNNQQNPLPFARRLFTNNVNYTNQYNNNNMHSNFNNQNPQNRDEMFSDYVFVNNNNNNIPNDNQYNNFNNNPYNNINMNQGLFSQHNFPFFSNTLFSNHLNNLNPSNIDDL
jgi:hypothetical protein